MAIHISQEVAPRVQGQFLAWNTKKSRMLSLHKTHKQDFGIVSSLDISADAISHRLMTNHNKAKIIWAIPVLIKMLFLIVEHNLHSVSSCNLLNSILKMNICPLAKSQCSFQCIAWKQSHRPLFSALRRRVSVWKEKKPKQKSMKSKNWIYCFKRVYNWLDLIPLHSCSQGALLSEKS